MSEKLKVGIIGTGGISVRHIRDFLSTGEAEIVALCDTSQKSLDTIKEKYPELADVNEYSSYTDVLKIEGLDAVQINTPHTLHYQQIMESLDAGLHVLAEKPMVCTVPHAKEIIKKVNEVNKILMIAYQRHFWPEYIFMKEYIDSGKIGEINFVDGMICQSWKNLTTNTWRQDPSLSGGGQLNDSGSHMVDIMLWVSGLKAKTVCAKINNCETPVDIQSALSIEFTNGANGTLSIAGNTPVWYEDFTVTGTKGAIFLRMGKVYVSTENESIVEVEINGERSNVERGFIDAIKGREPNRVSPECGLRVIELTEAAWTSDKTCTPCEVSSL
ncbi:MAG: Gfo/Idh/MocA family oxidoreductase [Armatimonadota bacterium]